MYEKETNDSRNQCTIPKWKFRTHSSENSLAQNDDIKIIVCRYCVNKIAQHDEKLTPESIVLYMYVCMYKCQNNIILTVICFLEINGRLRSDFLLSG